MREYIKIVSKDGKAIKTVPKDEYSLYAQAGWKECQENKNSAYVSPYGASAYRTKPE